MSADLPGISTGPPLLIMGSPRSGTTFLAHMVNRFFESGRYLEVRYERLMAAPAAVLTEILDFHGGGADRDARVERIGKEAASLVKEGNTEKWRTQAPDDGVRQVERVAGPLLHDLGYALVHPEIAGVPMGFTEMAWLQSDRLVRNAIQSKLRVFGRYRLEVLTERWRARVRA